MCSRMYKHDCCAWLWEGLLVVMFVCITVACFWKNQGPLLTILVVARSTNIWSPYSFRVGFVCFWHCILQSRAIVCAVKSSIYIRGNIFFTVAALRRLRCSLLYYHTA